MVTADAPWGNAAGTEDPDGGAGGGDDGVGAGCGAVAAGGALEAPFSAGVGLGGAVGSAVAAGAGPLRGEICPGCRIRLCASGWAGAGAARPVEGADAACAADNPRVPAKASARTQRATGLNAAVCGA